MSNKQREALKAAKKIISSFIAYSFVTAQARKKMQAVSDIIEAALTKPEQEPSQGLLATQRLIRGQKIIDWNRSQSEPPIAIAKEYWVADQLAQFYLSPKSRELQESTTNALENIASYLGLGGFNGATTEQLEARIKSEFDRFNSREWKELSEDEVKSCEWVLETEEEFEPYTGRSRWIVKGDKEYAKLLPAAPKKAPDTSIKG